MIDPRDSVPQTAPVERSKDKIEPFEIGIGVEDNKVVLLFKEPVKEFRIDPHKAKFVAQTIKDKAYEILASSSYRMSRTSNGK